MSAALPGLDLAALAEDAGLRELVKEALRRLSARAFAACLELLLQRLGYREARVLERDAGRPAKPGGYDLVARHATGLTTATLLVQAKRSGRPVPRRFVDELKGAMLRARAGQGLVVTLATFSPAARAAAAAADVAPVRLLDGEALAALLIRHRLGVRPAANGRWRLDGRFFRELERRHSARPRACLPGPKPRLAGAAGGMTGRTHALLAIGALWLLEPLQPGAGPGLVSLQAALAVAGALLPDLDASASAASRLEVGGVRPLAPLSALLQRAWGHRGPLHAPAGLLLAGLLALPLSALLGARPALAFCLGYASHLAGDACTKRGIPLAGKRRLHLLPKGLRLTTGSPAEDALSFALAGLALALLVRHL